MSSLPKSIHRCRRYPTKFNSGRDIPHFCLDSANLKRWLLEPAPPGVRIVESFECRWAGCYIRYGPDMNQSEIASFIWSVADLIRDTFKRGKYQDVILPFLRAKKGNGDET